MKLLTSSLFVLLAFGHQALAQTQSFECQTSPSNKLIVGTATATLTNLGFPKFQLNITVRTAEAEVTVVGQGRLQHSEDVETGVVRYLYQIRQGENRAQLAIESDSDKNEIGTTVGGLMGQISPSVFAMKCVRI